MHPTQYLPAYNTAPKALFGANLPTSQQVQAIQYTIPGQNLNLTAPYLLNRSTDHLSPASSYYNNNTGRDPHTVMKRLTEGVVQHQLNAQNHSESVHRKLAHAQNPHAIFIGCADSRVMPSELTGTSPGELFTIRNAGNIVPDPVRDPYNGELAGIHYATDNFDTQCVVVCGHANCGAVKGAMDLQNLKNPMLYNWLSQLKPLVDAIRQANPKAADTFLVNEIGRWNVVQQVNHVRNSLMQFPGNAADRIRNGSLQVVGWFYDFANERVEQFDPVSQKFIPIGIPSIQRKKP